MKIVPKRRYGQHFLRDTGILDRILRLIGPREDDLMLEIGAGDGALSSLLAPRVARLLAVEIDEDCIPALTEALRPFGNAVVVRRDILGMDLGGLLALRPDSALRVRVCGNLPYNIATAIIERLLQPGIAAADMHFMVQLEVGRRITAGPGSRDYGFLSVYCRHYCEARLAFKVPSACFVPRPNVTSAMVVLRPLNRRGSEIYEEAFVGLAKASFAYRRKKIVNSLRRHERVGSSAGALLEAAGIDGSRRAEELTIEEFEHLASTALTGGFWC